MRWDLCESTRDGSHSAESRGCSTSSVRVGCVERWTGRAETACGTMHQRTSLLEFLDLSATRLDAYGERGAVGSRSCFILPCEQRATGSKPRLSLPCEQSDVGSRPHLSLPKRGDVGSESLTLSAARHDVRFTSSSSRFEPTSRSSPQPPLSPFSSSSSTTSSSSSSSPSSSPPSSLLLSSVSCCRHCSWRHARAVADTGVPVVASNANHRFAGPSGGQLRYPSMDLGLRVALLQRQDCGKPSLTFVNLR